MEEYRVTFNLYCSAYKYIKDGINYTVIIPLRTDSIYRNKGKTYQSPVLNEQTILVHLYNNLFASLHADEQIKYTKMYISSEREYFVVFSTSNGCYIYHGFPTKIEKL